MFDEFDYLVYLIKNNIDIFGDFKNQGLIWKFKFKPKYWQFISDMINLDDDTKMAIFTEVFGDIGPYSSAERCKL